MPNYRNKNRNRNKNKQRNKQQQQQQQQNQQQKTENTKNDCKTEITAPTTDSQESTPPPLPPLSLPPANVASQKTASEVQQLNASAVSLDHKNVAKIDAAAAASAAIIEEVPDIVTTNSATYTNTTNDTVLNEPSVCKNSSESEKNYAVINDHHNNMGNEKSKLTETKNEDEKSSSVNVTPPKSPFVGQVIVHRIICEDTNEGNQANATTTAINDVATSTAKATEKTTQISNKMVRQEAKSENQTEEEPFKVFIHNILNTKGEVPVDETKTATETQQTLPNKTIIHKISMDSNEKIKPNTGKGVDQQLTDKVSTTNDEPPANQQVIVHKVSLANEDAENDADDSSSQSDTAETTTQHQVKVIVHEIHVEDKDDTVDEQPIITSPVQREPTCQPKVKSSTSDVRIVEISDESLSDLEELRSPVVSEAESSIEYSDEMQRVSSDSITEISSTTSSSSNTSTNQKQARKQKRIALEHHFLPQMLNPRFLDSISEENSELSDNSDNPLSRSASTDSATNCPTEAKVQKLNAKYPKSSLDFTKPHKHHQTHRKSKVIREEPVAMAVSARLQDAPDTEADESCTTLRSCMSPEAEAAEVVFINSASSSMSDLHDTELYDNVPVHVNSAITQYDLDKGLNELVNKAITDNIYPSTPLTSQPTAFAHKHTTASATKNLPEFGKTEIINNSRHVNNQMKPLPLPLPDSSLHTNETKTDNTEQNTDSRSSILLSSSSLSSSSPSSLVTTITATATGTTPTPTLTLSTLLPANEHLVFAQIEEQISSVLSSINEVATQNTNKTITSTSTSTSSCMKTHTNLSNTQKLPVTTTSITTITTPPTMQTAATASKLATRTLENSCESFNTDSSLCAGNNAKTTRLFIHNNAKDTMNTVRDLLNNNNSINNHSNSNSDIETVKLNGNHGYNETSNGYVKNTLLSNNTFVPIPPPRSSPPPPPIPPPPQEMYYQIEQQPTNQQNSYEYDKMSSAFATATPNNSTNNASSLPLLQKNVDLHNNHTQSNSFKPALGLLNSTTTLSSSSMKRQESMDSHCSDSTNFSQCTAINMATELPACDLAKTSSISDLKTTSTSTSTTPTPTPTVQSVNQQNVDNSGDPKKLRLLCAETVASLPYGDEVLEELATVAQNIGEARAVKAFKSQENNMPYPLPQLPHIDDLQLSLKVGKTNSERILQPQQQDQSWLGVPTTIDPKVLVCLSPSQRSYIQQKPEQKPDDLLDAHQKFIERRGYHEYTKEQLEFLEREKFAEQQLLQTAAMMKKLRKSLTPPPPQIPPPPVPVKSSETATKAQNLSKRTITTTTTTSVNHTQNSSDDANLIHCAEQMKASANGENNGEENKHRLLSIIQDTSESNANKQNHTPTTSSSSSSHENNSRQTANGHSSSNVQQVVTATSTLNNNTSKNSYQFPQLSKHNTTGSMQSVETSLGQMFPTMGSSNIFDQEHKRFSNIESFSKEPFCSQLMDTQPKRYSSVETHYFETQKRCENGQVVQDFTTSKHETETSGNKPEAVTNFPLKSLSTPESNSFFRSGKQPEIYNKPTAQNNNNQEIMSALKLNKQSSDTKTETETKKTSNTLESETTIKSIKTIEEKASQNKNANDDVYKSSEEQQQYVAKESTFRREGIQDSYEEFRQRAKAAADSASTLPTLNLTATATAAAPPHLTAKVTSNGDNDNVISSIMSTTDTSTSLQNKSTKLRHDHERLFKEFDDLSKQLHKELETSKAEREQREKSASMFDLNRGFMRHKQQIKEYNKSRHDHLKELEQQIERSMRSRSMLFNKTPEPVANTDTVDHQSGRTYEIPIRIENGYTPIPKAAAAAHEEAPPVPEPPKTYNIPIQIENANNGAQVDESRFRRAESMFNLSDDMHHRQRTLSNQSHFLRTDDDWSKYASDLGSSENIARPFAKEVEICYQRRPGGIRAPRLTASTNDLSFNNQQHSYDQYNAYNVRRQHAPMLNRAPESARPKFGSCYSMIERDPNPKYISTTTRRGVSPAPQPSGYFPLEGYHVREEDMRQRRASLPREIHEQQLKYIASKEEELRTEFERLQAERRRLMEEAQKAQAMQMPQTPTSPITPTRPLRDSYRSTQKLPTLTEDEVFRQQMAEEWLNKVAEREKRRLQNIIKISKIHEDEATLRHKADMEQEFLSRVKERRHKLAMPADSDWESGAESQPAAQAQHSETEDIPPVRFLEGEKEANLRRLPRHLREFAKFSNHQKENIEGGHREEHQEEERTEEATDNSMSRAVKKSTVVKTVKTLRAPMLPANGGHGHDAHQLTNHKPRVQQLPIRPRDPHLTDRGQRKCQKQTRFAVNTNRRSWSESDLLQEIEKDLKLAKGFLFQDVYNVKHEYMSEPETEHEHPKKMAQLGRRQYDGIGPMTNDGMPIILRSEVKEPHQHEWYKRLYQTIHKQKHGGRNLYNKPNGYQSEPEPNYDSDYSTIKYRTVNPNRLQSVSSAVNVRRSNDSLYGTLPNPVKSGQNSYKNQPGRIEDYITGHSSVSEKEKKEQLDQAQLSSHYTEGNLSRALAKESGYTSDPNLVFRKKEIPQSSTLSPVEQKQAYKNVQAGGEPPLFGFRKPAPEKSKDYDFPNPKLPPPPKGELLDQRAVSPNRYYESDVNIHFKTPVRQELKYPLSEEELAIRQAEQMQKLYQEERRRKYLQELQDMNSRRHTDNFTPSQKSPIPLNRYDDFPADLAPKTGINQLKSVARALYNFQAQNSKELSFKKGDIIYIRRAIDKNWYEGEHNAMIGLFPANYVEIINKESVHPVQPQSNAYRKPSEGQARAKYNFQAQSAVELSLNKGELVALTRRVDDNWFEGRIANRKGIFPISYVEVLTDIGAEDIAARTTTTQQARPTLDALRTNINNEFNTLTRNGNQPPNAILRETRNHKTDILHVDTSSEPLVYRALYKYRPQNSDELELQEGDIVHVLEKCDDGWYVGTSQRTGCFGTFPGNYVERV